MAIRECDTYCPYFYDDNGTGRCTRDHMARVSYGSPCKLGLEEDPAKREAMKEIWKKGAPCGCFFAICILYVILSILVDEFPALKEFLSSVYNWFSNLFS